MTVHPFPGGGPAGPEAPRRDEPKLLARVIIGGCLAAGVLMTIGLALVPLAVAAWIFRAALGH